SRRAGSRRRGLRSLVVFAFIFGFRYFLAFAAGKGEYEGGGEEEGQELLHGHRFSWLAVGSWPLAVSDLPTANFERPTSFRVDLAGCVAGGIDGCVVTAGTSPPGEAARIWVMPIDQM